MPFVHDGTLVMSMALARAISPPDAETLEAGLIAPPATMLIPSGRQPADLMQSSPTCKNSFLPNACADGSCGCYVKCSRPAFMAVQVLVIELDNPYLEDQLDRIADTLNNDERYRPSQFAAMLAALAEPEPEAEDIDEQDE